MYELIQVLNNSYYIQSPAKIGLVRLDDAEVCLIDSGSDKDAGRKVRQVLDANGWRLRAIYNTHAHADHTGGNKFLQQRTGCKIYVPGTDCSLARHPILEPASLYGGCPFGDLRHKFLMAQESDAEYLTPQALPAGFEWIPLPGHSFDMAGYRTPDGVAYIGDCLASRETLDKYGIVFLYDVAAYIRTLEKVAAMEAEMFVPSHADAVRDVSELARYNIDKVYEVAEKILDLCAEPQRFETILQHLFGAYSLTMTMEQHALVGSTVRSYLAWLKDEGRLAATIKNNLLLWARA